MMATPTTMKGRPSASEAKSLPDRLPMSQWVMAGSLSLGSATYLSMEMTALKMALTMTPARTSITMLVRPWRCDTATVSATDARPATRAMTCVVNMSADSMMAITAPTQAPLVTPSVSGVASGLESRLWNAAPAHARPAPSATASTMRGRRRLKTTERTTFSRLSMLPVKKAPRAPSTWSTPSG